MLRHVVLGAALVAFAGPALADSEAPAEKPAETVAVVKPADEAAAATPADETATPVEASAPATTAAGSMSTPKVKFGGSGCSWSTAEAPMS